MIITGKCAICGRPVGVEIGELGKVPPPDKCPQCAEDAAHIMEQLEGIVTGKWREKG